MSTDLIGSNHDLPAEDEHDDTGDTDDTVEVRRDGPLSAVIGALGAAVSVAYLLRAVGSGSLLDWGLCLLTGLIGLAFLSALVDARAPLMVLDRHGVRVRRGREWHGLAWTEVERVEHRPRQTLLRDGSLVVVAVEGAVSAPRLAVRLSLSTRLAGADWHELGEALSDLSGGRTTLVEPEPAARPERAPEPKQESGSEPAPAETSTEEPQAVAPARDLARGRRSEVVLDRRPAPDADDTRVVVRPASPVDPSRHSHTAPADPAETTIVIDGAAADPDVGSCLRAARTRLGLSVDQLADRTRIRPHVIESIEVDDFGPCGGDFYARGHLRTLARVLGVDVDPLLADYDVRYADAPIDPRRVFEAELATGAGGSIRGTRGRLNWSVLIAAVMAVVLVWSVARLVLDAPAQVSDQPVLNGSPGGRAQLSGAASEKVEVRFTAATGGARVTVRDARGQIAFDDELAFMQTASVDAVPPVRIRSTDGGVTVSVDGAKAAALGATGQQAQRVFVPS